MPRVIINDKSLLLILGEWLKIENLNESDANLEKLEETIKYDLSQIFSMAGIDKSEICILDQYYCDDERLTCHFINANNGAKMSLFIGSGQKITIDYKNEEKVLGFYRDLKENEIKLYAIRYVYKNKTNGNKYIRYLFSSVGGLTIKNDGDKYLYLSIVPKEHDESIYYFDNEEKVKEYLCSLSFPVNIVEVYDKLSEITNGLLRNCNRLALEQRKIIDEDYSELMDTIALINGELLKFKITRGDKTITINNNGSWSFKTAKFSMSKGADGSFDYSAHLKQDERLRDFDWNESADQANKDIGEAMVITDRITKKH